jgi:hypothetical protein
LGLQLELGALHLEDVEQDILVHRLHQEQGPLIGLILASKLHDRFVVEDGEYRGQPNVLVLLPSLIDMLNAEVLPSQA